MKTVTKSFAVLSAILLVTYLLRYQHKTPAPEKEQTSSRILGDFGGYTIQTDPDKKKYCDDEGVANNDIFPSDSEIKDKQDFLSSKFDFLRDPLEKTITGEPGYSITSEVMTVLSGLAFPMLANLVLFLFSFFCFPFLCCWCICSGTCCKKKTCCLKKRQEGAKESCWVKCTSYTVIGIGVGLLVVAIILFVHSNMLVSSFKYPACGLNMMYTDIKNGVKENGLIFVGSKGVNYLGKELAKSLTKINAKTSGGGSVSLTDIAGKSLDTKGQALLDDFDAFRAAWKAKEIVGADGTSSTHIPASAALFQDANVVDLLVEITKVGEAAKKVDASTEENLDLVDGATNIVNVNDINSAFDEIEKVFNDLLKQLGDVKDVLVSIVGQDAFKQFAVIFTWAVVFTIGGFSTFILVLLVMSVFFNKCKCALSVSKFFMVIEMGCSVIINLVGSLLVVSSAVLVNVCYIIDKAFNDKTFISDISSELANVLSPCFYADSTGDLIGETLNGAQTADIEKVNVVIQGLNVPTDLSDFFTGPSAPNTPQADLTLSKLTAFTTYADNSEWVNFGAASPITGMTNFNNFNTGGTCAGASDEIQVLGASCTEAEKTVGVYTDAGDVCYSFLWFEAANIAPTATRFNGKCGASPGDTGDGMMENMRACLQDYSTEIKGTMLTAFNAIKTQQDTILTDISDSIATLEEYKTEVGETMVFLGDLSNDVTTALNCTVVRREIKIIQNVVCYQFVVIFTKMAFSIAYLGPFLFFFSICICCTIRCKKANMVKSSGQGSNKIHPVGRVDPINKISPMNKMMEPIGLK